MATKPKYVSKLSNTPILGVNPREQTAEAYAYANRAEMGIPTGTTIDPFKEQIKRAGVTSNPIVKGVSGLGATPARKSLFPNATTAPGTAAPTTPGVDLAAAVDRLTGREQMTSPENNFNPAPFVREDNPVQTVSRAVDNWGLISGTSRLIQNLIPDNLEAKASKFLSGLASEKDLPEESYQKSIETLRNTSLNEKVRIYNLQKQGLSLPEAKKVIEEERTKNEEGALYNTASTLSAIGSLVGGQKAVTQGGLSLLSKASTLKPGIVQKATQTLGNILSQGEKIEKGGVAKFLSATTGAAGLGALEASIQDRDTKNAKELINTAIGGAAAAWLFGAAGYTTDGTIMRAMNINKNILKEDNVLSKAVRKTIDIFQKNKVAVSTGKGAAQAIDTLNGMYDEVISRTLNAKNLVDTPLKDVVVNVDNINKSVSKTLIDDIYKLDVHGAGKFAGELTKNKPTVKDVIEKVRSFKTAEGVQGIKAMPRNDDWAVAYRNIDESVNRLITDIDAVQGTAGTPNSILAKIDKLVQTGDIDVTTKLNYVENAINQMNLLQYESLMKNLSMGYEKNAVSEGIAKITNGFYSSGRRTLEKVAPELADVIADKHALHTVASRYFKKQNGKTVPKTQAQMQSDWERIKKATGDLIVPAAIGTMTNINPLWSLGGVARGTATVLKDYLGTGLAGRALGKTRPVDTVKIGQPKINLNLAPKEIINK